MLFNNSQGPPGQQFSRYLITGTILLLETSVFRFIAALVLATAIDWVLHNLVVL